MRIRVLNAGGDQLKVSPQINSALENLGRQADKSGTNWQEISNKMLRVLEGDNFDPSKLQLEINYCDTKNGKEVFSFIFNYSA
jgi:hypothetical protein